MKNIILNSITSSKKSNDINDGTRTILGFLLGFGIMSFVVNIFNITDFDFNNMAQGVSTMISGVNPWSSSTRIDHFYNPPFSIIFLWPLIFITPKLILILGGALLFAVVFYQKAWVGLAWFITNSFLKIISAGGIDMYVIGAGLLCLFAGDKYRDHRWGTILRVLGYGFLMVKPQGGIFIVAIYILTKRDWKGLFTSVVVYGFFFIPLYPDWIRVLLTDPPLVYNAVNHSVWSKFGPLITIPIAVWIIFSRKWEFWQLGGALASILSPYGMPGVPVFLTLTAVRNWVAIPIFVIYSGCLAILTWVPPPPEIEFFKFTNPMLSIYNLNLIAVALILAGYFKDKDVSTN